MEIRLDLERYAVQVVDTMLKNYSFGKMSKRMKTSCYIHIRGISKTDKPAKYKHSIRNEALSMFVIMIEEAFIRQLEKREIITTSL
jgi:hypothetical protein